MGGALGWLYLELGLLVVPLLMAPVLIARHGFGTYLNQQAAYERTLRTFVEALEEKDPYTAGHVERVATYADRVGRELRLPRGRRQRLRYAALLHDVGKLVVPNSLLNKPGRLTAEEFAVVKRHDEVSVRIIEQIDFLRSAAPGASNDFSRYGESTSGPIEAYIVAVADAYDAMTSTRAYRQALSQEVAFEELRRSAGTQFHPACVEALIRNLTRSGERHGAGTEEAASGFAVPPPIVGTGSAGLGDLAPSPEHTAPGPVGEAA
jgi:HD-GYP domain-containing protein (c-di-GMP phosphodiesterase class II)